MALIVYTNKKPDCIHLNVQSGKWGLSIVIILTINHQQL